MANPTINEWADMMPDSVTLNAFLSRSVSGAPSYNPTGVAYVCRIEMKNHLIIDHVGREVMARGRVFLLTTTIPSIQDKLTLPSEYIPVNPPIMAVNVVSDDTGNHHVTLEIG